MPTITIPKQVSDKTKLVAVPESIYEEFVAWQKHVKSKKTYHPTPAEKRMIAEGRKRFAQGKFVTVQELRNDLERRR